MGLEHDVANAGTERCREIASRVDVLVWVAFERVVDVHRWSADRLPRANADQNRHDRQKNPLPLQTGHFGRKGLRGSDLRVFVNHAQLLELVDRILTVGPPHHVLST